jgi:hypothetical protein
MHRLKPTDILIGERSVHMRKRSLDLSGLEQGNLIEIPFFFSIDLPQNPSQASRPLV